MAFSKLRRFFLFLTLVGFLSGTVGNIVNAADTATMCSDAIQKASNDAFMHANDVLYFDECAVCTSSNSVGGASGTSTPTATGQGANGLSAQQIAFIDKYHDIAQQLSIQYGIPWEAVMAQGLEESSAGTDELARTKNNFFGINAVDSDPYNHADTFATPEAGWKGYYDWIANNRTYREHGVFQGQAITDPQAYLQDIKNAGYATDPQYVSKNMAIVNGIDAYAASKGWDNSAALSQKNPQMATNAAKNAQGGNASSGSSSGGTSGGSSNNAACSTSTASTAGSGTIAATAGNMGAWGGQYQACYSDTAGGHGSTDDLKQRIDNHFAPAQYGVDCSGFARAVIYQATGTDPGSMTTDSMCADSSKFDHIPRSQAQPGDFAIDCSTHVEVITNVNGDGSFNTVGSHSTGCGPGHGPSPGNFQGNSSYVLRYKG